MEQTESCQRGGREGGGTWMKEGEGISQTTCMHDPCSWTMVWGLPEGVGEDRVQGSKRGKLGQL